MTYSIIRPIVAFGLGAALLSGASLAIARQKSDPCVGIDGCGGGGDYSDAMLDFFDFMERADKLAEQGEGSAEAEEGERQESEVTKNFTWKHVGSGFSEIAPYPGGKAYALASSTLPTGDHPLYHYDGAQWSAIPGGAYLKIAVKPDGSLWGVTASGQISTYVFVRKPGTGGRFDLPRYYWEFRVMPGCAQDIGIGGRIDQTFDDGGFNGKPWVIGCGGANNDSYHWDMVSHTWTRLPGAVAHVAVQPDGSPWFVTAEGAIWRRGTSWTAIEGCAIDIGTGARGKAWVIGCGSAGPGGNEIYRWKKDHWVLYPGAAVRIAVDAVGIPWVISSDGSVYHP